MSLLHIAILSPLLLAIFVPFIYKITKNLHLGWFVLPLPVILFTFFFLFLGDIKDGQAITSSVEWISFLDISFDVYIDGLGLLFALLITGIGALVVLYSIYYLNKHKEQLNTFYVYLLLFMGAMLGVVLSDNLIVLYAFWELTSFSSFLLIGYWNEREKSRYGAQKSMLITVFGGLSLLGAIILLYVMTGTFSIREIITQADVVLTHELLLPTMVLFLLGAFTKSAQFPFHIWLPDAMEAPTPVSAYLHSATMVKAGIYLVARFTPLFGITGEWFWMVASVGIITLFWGSFNAVKQTDLKGILAFSTVSQLGMIMSMLGAGAASIHFAGPGENKFIVAVAAAIFHLVNHATFKGSLFMVVGIVDHETGVRDIRRLGGLMTVMPITATIAFLGSFSMAGIPPFNGFLSKEMFFTSMIRITEMGIFDLETWGILFPVLAWVGSIFTFIYSMILFFKTFTGKLDTEKLEKKPHEAPLGMLIPPVILASLVVILSFFPNLAATNIIEPAMASILPSLLGTDGIFEIHIYHWHGFDSFELYMTIGVIVLGTLLYKILPKWSGVYNRLPKQVTWNYFYDRGVELSQLGSYNFTKSFMTGSIRSYLAYMLIFFIVTLLWTLGFKDAFALSMENTSPIRVYEVILALVVIAGSITILAAKSRLTSIIALGAVGYTVSLFFVVFRAPDLALTQLVIETVSVALFLACFYHLPKLKREERIRFKLNNALISLGVGVTVALIAMSAHSTKIFKPISEYYIENTYELAHGKNMVNVILVDFRGFDTLFEICVLGIASLGIYGMIKLRLSGKGEQHEK
ncbi:Na+/H+ antiporter subunit A [Bacillus litorisediminis]|uniref:Na+/H+ antiporter subunit A n=1 Tax=Bacillus litorisediminis TaxID=2922713 RepID=UPI001FABA377|nr:Na+/H+ antiporter subunit A [Bacillus litorisediminis]